jgi:hypothetical protein
MRKYRSCKNQTINLEFGMESKEKGGLGHGSNSKEKIDVLLTLPWFPIIQKN